MPFVLLIRHGDTDFLGKRLAGRLPGIFLNEIGLQQAEELAQALVNQPIHAIYSSPLERTLQTARSVAISHQLPVQVEPDLIEVDYGSFQGMAFEELRQLEFWKQVQSDPHKASFPCGEALVEAQKRAADIIEKISALCGEQDVVACFTHGDVIRLALAYFLQMPLGAYQRLFIHTASISVVQFLPNKVRVLQINQLPGQNVNIPALISN